MAHVEHYFTRFEFEGFYHIYNRAVDKRPLFRSEDNCQFFLRRYMRYVWPVAETLGYCLMGNHFHVIVRIRPEEHIRLLGRFPEKQVILTANRPEWATCAGVHACESMCADAGAPDLTTFTKLSNLPPTIQSQKSAHDIVFHQFRKFFQSYAMAFNKQHNRCGTLFQTPFKRAHLDTEDYIRRAITYVHLNPVENGSVMKPEEWKWSSYNSLTSQSETWLCKPLINSIFTSAEEFKTYHSKPVDSEFLIHPIEKKRAA